MKQLVFGICSVLLCTAIGVSVYAASLNNFTITRFNIDYELSRDNDGRSRLSTTETITAKFPDYDQNHGIERVIPLSYDGHSVSLDIKSIKNAGGTPLPYEERSENENRILRIGDADTYVRGEQTYVITYLQRDVTKTFVDTGDEFYWDTNGTDWKVPIERLNVTLEVDDQLEPALGDKSACYQGSAGAAQSCNLIQNGNVYTVSQDSLVSGQNITIAVGFKNATFREYEKSLWEKVLATYILVTLIISVIPCGLIIWFIVRANRWSERKHEQGTIIAEYTPPKNTSLTASASLLTVQGSVFSAQLLDFAIRGYLKVYQTREKSFWKTAEYDIEITKNISTLKAEEQEVLKDIFGNQIGVGSRLALKTLKNNTSLYNRTLDNDKKLKELVRGEYGLRYKDEAKRKWFKKAGFISLTLGVLLLNPLLLLSALVAFICGATLWPLSDEGLALSRYLEGLKEYIKVAETDRIKMLQSPEGAEKIGDVDVVDGAQLVKLYEKVLPYAVLFGQEKEWTKRLGDIYESIGSNPAWYGSSSSAFNAAMFSSAVSGFSSAASYSSASSSSSGGSSGGGSSGGGGGGGGGGGW